ncbi:phage holin family protein [Candidatus Daviesbacteria bacterium]|nr:phage holin family protein [Candidatus Daviesbacteria bacterium]
MGLLISLLLNTLALIITAYIVPGIKVDTFTSALLAAIVLGIINTFIKPVLVLLTLPLTIITLGLFIFIVNAIVLRVTTIFVPGFMVDGWVPAILGAIVLSIASTILSTLVKDFSLFNYQINMYRTYDL